MTTRTCLARGLVAAGLLPLAVLAGGDAPLPQGDWTGVSAACTGRLSIGAQRLTWRMPTSDCADLPYRVIEHDGGGDRRPVLFELKERGPACRFAVLELQPPAGAQGAWQLRAYGTVAEHRARAFERTQLCEMRRAR